MSNHELLAQLMAQAAVQGADLATLRAMAEEIGELAAERALARLGLDDPAAARDMDELRQLMRAWRDARKSAWRAAVGWVARVLGTVTLAGLAVRFGIEELPK
ncbi:DUF6127 family protein [Sphingomonas sp.]|uniref:DUF6127 family protein n=1 Tax=Sphingomonas sp. TaxID=28214 RepID=UPI001D48E016|nr:DUF6127 family protein [Sphingomonas sp.]MBX9796009.1 hypothetical protein [Sphingomonas sp.]